jgi:hypothetical protein
MFFCEFRSVSCLFCYSTSIVRLATHISALLLIRSLWLHTHTRRQTTAALRGWSPLSNPPSVIPTAASRVSSPGSINTIHARVPAASRTTHTHIDIYIRIQRIRLRKRERERNFLTFFFSCVCISSDLLLSSFPLKNKNFRLFYNFGSMLFVHSLFLCVCVCVSLDSRMSANRSGPLTSLHFNVCL